MINICFLLEAFETEVNLKILRNGFILGEFWKN